MVSIWRRIPSDWMTSSKIWLSARCLLHGPARLSKSPDGDHVGCGVPLSARLFCRYQCTTAGSQNNRDTRAPSSARFLQKINGLYGAARKVWHRRNSLKIFEPGHIAGRIA